MFSSLSLTIIGFLLILFSSEISPPTVFINVMLNNFDNLIFFENNKK